MDIKELQKLKPSKQLHIINSKYEKYIKTVIHSSFKIYFGLPETEEDFYWTFMYEVPRLIEEFQGETEKDFTRFLGMKCKFYTLNKCKKLIGKSYTVLNNSIPLDDKRLLSEQQTPSSLNDAEQSINFSTHIESLSPFELKVYKLYFLESCDVSDIVKNLNASRYMVNKAIGSIRKKFQKSINLEK